MKDLISILTQTKQLLTDPTIKWKSYDVDWVYPREARLWTEIETFSGTIRVTYQKFYPIDINDNNQMFIDSLYYHNHPWPKEMYIVKGDVKHGISTTNNPLYYMRHSNTNEKIMQNDLINNELAVLYHGKDSYFSFDNIKTWHYLKPLYQQPVYSIMITYEPWIKGPKAPHVIKEVSSEEINDIKKTMLEWFETSMYKLS